MQQIRRIGACENAQAQPDWAGKAIEPCPAAAAFVCAVCGHLLCGAHASGHQHAGKDDASDLQQQFQRQAQAVTAAASAVAQAEAAFQAALQEAQKGYAQIKQIRQLVAE